MLDRYTKQLVISGYLFCAYLIHRKETLKHNAHTCMITFSQSIMEISDFFFLEKRIGSREEPHSDRD